MINKGYEVRDSYDFVIKNHRIEKTINGKKIVEKKRMVIWTNGQISNDCNFTYRLTDDNVPSELKNVEIVNAPNPFVLDYDNGGKYSDYTWDFSSVLLAFKLGYIDGLFSRKSSLFGIGMLEHGIIVIDPIQRIKVREYFSEEFKNFLDKIDEKDFVWGIKAYSEISSYRIGTDKEHNLDYWKSEVTKDYKDPNTNCLVKEDDWEKGLSIEERVNRIAFSMYYCCDIYNLNNERTANHLAFSTRDEAEKFVKTLTEKDIRNLSFETVLVNDVFTDWLHIMKV